MKKVMIGILIVIPLVVLLVMGLVTTFVSVNAYIGVESVELDKHDLTLEVNETYKLDGDGGLFVVTVLPERATDKTYEWSIRNVRSRDANYPDGDNGKDGFWYVELLDANGNHTDTVTAGGSIRINVHCNFEIVVTAETYTDVCTVVVGGDITAISLDDSITLRAGSSEMLSAVFTPMDGAAYNVEWHVSESVVASVDRNGIITGLREGETEVWMSAEDSKGNVIESNRMVVTVTAGATAYGDIVNVHYDGFDIENELGISPEDITACVGCTVEDGIFRFEEGATRAVIEIEGSDTPAIINLCEENAIEIVERGALGDYILEVGGEELYLTARYASVFRRGESVEVIWSSSDTQVATVDENGAVTGLSSGDAVITATATDGGAEAELTLEVQRKVAVLVSAVTQDSLEVGLAQETVFASMKFDDGALVDNTFSVGVLYPAMFEGEDEESFYEAFGFTTDRPDLAYYNDVDGDGIPNNLLTFNGAAIEAAAENGEKIDITVTVRAKYPKYANLPEYTTASFVITVVDGVSVGDYASLKRALETEKKSAVFLNDIPVENAAGQDGATNIYTYGSVYGNGYTVSAEKDQMIGKTEPIFHVYADNVVFSNLTIRPNTFSDEDIENGDLTIDDASTFTSGYCIKYNIRARNSATGETVTQIKGSRIEFCILENATTLVQLSGAEVEIEGSIMRNTGGVGIHVRNALEGSIQFYNNLTLTNCVMSNMVGTGINLDWNYSNSKYDESAGQRSTFTQKGFLDMYNWQPGESLTLLPLETLKEIGLNESTAQVLIGALQDMLLEEKNLESVRREVDGVTYIHLGFMSMGLGKQSHIMYGYDDEGRRAERVYDVNTGEMSARYVDTQEAVDPDEISWNMTLEDSRIKWFCSSDISLLNRISGLLEAVGLNIRDNPIYLFGYNDETTDLVPGMTYTVNSKLIERLHGEA